MTVGHNTITPPSDFLDPHLLYITANGSVTGYGPAEIRLATVDQVISRYTYDSSGSLQSMQPTCYYFDAGGLELDYPPDLAYPYSLIYYQQPAALSVSNTTNFITQYYPRLLRCAIMAFAVEWSKESGSGQYDRTYWLAAAQAELDEAQRESDFAKRSSSNSLGMVML